MMTPRHARPASIPTICNNRANPPTKGKPIGMPKPIPEFPVNILRITPAPQIDDRGNCGQSTARVHFTPSLLNFSTLVLGITPPKEQRVFRRCQLK